MPDADMNEADIIELRVERPANGGEAVGRGPDGRVVFVRGAIPGERVTARLTDTGRAAFWRAQTLDVIEVSPHRVDPVCPAAARGAGCCDLSFIAPDAAREYKAAAAADVLTRIGRLPAELLTQWGLPSGTGDPGVPSGVAARVVSLADDPTGWRVRTRLAVDAAGRAGLRVAGGAAIVTGSPCAQSMPGTFDGLDARRFTPAAELAVVVDDTGSRHITEVAPVAAGR
ncbi:MAG: TRAM domain-containing protein, partial [Gordonia sp. (in: high G+C Gram-positive bacteria)]